MLLSHFCDLAGDISQVIKYNVIKNKKSCRSYSIYMKNGSICNRIIQSKNTGLWS